MCKRFSVLILCFIVAVLFAGKDLKAFDGGYGSNDDLPPSKNEKIAAVYKNSNKFYRPGKNHKKNKSVSSTGFKLTKKDEDLIALMQKPVPLFYKKIVSKS